jgi:DNA-binding winged helix-turn-helix (wHTH) protein
MRSDSDVFRFGPFELDSTRRRLMRGPERVRLPDSYVDVLLLFTTHPGEIISKDSLAEAAWKVAAVDDNNIAQAVSRLRKALGHQKDGSPFIENIPWRGYRFVAPVARAQPGHASVALDALVAPYRAFVEGRAALERLDCEAVGRARQAFEGVLRAAPDDPSAHIGLANACVMEFESTRVDETPDVAALQRAVHHAREGCRLDPASGEAWSTLAFVRHRLGEADEAIADARKAIALEPYDWCHYLRLASVSWGGRRLRAAHRVLHMCPGLALANWFAATVLVARHQFDAALEKLRAGCAAQDAQRTFHAVGLHLLHGLVLAACGSSDEALEEFSRELECGNERHLYARESCANAWYAIGALRLRQGRGDAAAAAFHEAVTRVPGHALAAVGLAAIVGPSQAHENGHDANAVDKAIVKAAALALQGRHRDAAHLCGDALSRADRGPAGWLLPVDPLIHATAHRGAWSHTLAILRHRAA